MKSSIHSCCSSSTPISKSSARALLLSATNLQWRLDHTHEPSIGRVNMLQSQCESDIVWLTRLLEQVPFSCLVFCKTLFLQLWVNTEVCFCFSSKQCWPEAAKMWWNDSQAIQWESCWCFQFFREQFWNWLVVVEERAKSFVIFLCWSYSCLTHNELFMICF